MSPRPSLFALCLALPLLGRAEDPATFPVGGLTFTRPQEWKWIPVSSPMRKAQLQAPAIRTRAQKRPTATSADLDRRAERHQPPQTLDPRVGTRTQLCEMRPGISPGEPVAGGER